VSHGVWTGQHRPEVIHDVAVGCPQRRTRLAIAAAECVEVGLRGGSNLGLVALPRRRIRRRRSGGEQSRG